MTHNDTPTIPTLLKDENKKTELLLDQVLGQPKAVKAIQRAAQSNRNLLLIGLPGTGKSLLGSALAELLPSKQLSDVICQKNSNDIMQPRIKIIPVGEGAEFTEKENQLANKMNNLYNFFSYLGLFFLVALGYTFYSFTNVIGFVEVLFSLLLGITWIMYRQRNAVKLLDHTSSLLIKNDHQNTPFIDASGSTSNLLLGDIRHDPYQSGGLETPPHHLVIPGLIHKAHGGVLFIDEIGTLDPETQFHLLTAMQEGKLAIKGRGEASSSSVVITEPVPCQFTLVAAGNIETVERLHPALRSRIQGFGMEVLMESHIQIDKFTLDTLSKFIHQELIKEDKTFEIPSKTVSTLGAVAERMGHRDGFISLQFRELGGIMRAASDLAKADGRSKIDPVDIINAEFMQGDIELQLGLQKQKMFLEETSIGWDKGLFWSQQFINGKFVYDLVKIINTRTNEKDAFLLGLIQALSTYEIIPSIDDINFKLSPESIIDDKSIPAVVIAGIIGYLNSTLLPSNLLFIGGFDNDLIPLPYNMLASSIAHAINVGYDKIIAVVKEDLRFFPIMLNNVKISIITSKEQFIEELKKYL